MVQAAVAKEFPRRLRADGVVLRSDAGSQFIAHVFRESMKVLGIELEAIRKKRPEDKGIMADCTSLDASHTILLEPASLPLTFAG